MILMVTRWTATEIAFSTLWGTPLHNLPQVGSVFVKFSEIWIFTQKTQMLLRIYLFHI